MMLVPLSFVALFTVATASVASEQAACVEIVTAGQGTPLRKATFAVYTGCRTKGLHGGSLEPGCRELARLYSVARHYSDASGGNLASEEFCANAVGSALEQGSMQEVDACVAGAEEVLSSSEVSEAAEKACRRAHPKAAGAAAACRTYVAKLSEALHRAPKGELVDAESICGQLVGGSAAAEPNQVQAVASSGDGKENPDERKFLTSCVQFAGNLMASPTIDEDQVRKSCEVHLSSEEKLFCAGYARLVNQRADATDFSNFCVAEYRRMSLTVKPKTKLSSASAIQHSAQPKKASSTAMNMPALCANIFTQAVTAGLSGAQINKAASDLCTEELSHLAMPAARVRVGCKFFAGRFAMMKAQQGAAATTADVFCAQMASQHHTTAHPAKPAVAVTSNPVAVPVAVAVAVPQPVAAPHPPTPAVAVAPKLAAPQPVVLAVSRSSPIQRHGPALLAPKPLLAKAPPASTPASPLPQASVPAKASPVVAQVVPLPVNAASAVLPALAASAIAIAPPPTAEDAAKAKTDEAFLNKFLDKYEATDGAAGAPIAKVSAPQPQMKVFRDDEMAEVRRKAAQLFGSDVETKPVAAVPAPTQPAVAHQPVVPVAPSAPAALPAMAVKAASKVAVPVAAGASSLQTSELVVDSGNKDAADFLSSFLNTYTGNGDDSKSAPPPPAQPAPAQQPPQHVSTPTAALSPLALLAELPATEASPIGSMDDGPLPSSGATDVDSMVSAFLAKN